MLDVAFDYDGYKFRSVKECDINILSRWMKKNNNEDHVSLTDEQILYRRFLEYYITEDEFFIKVIKDEKIYGVIKGNITRENDMELFLWMFIIDKKNRDRGEGKKIIESFFEYACKKYSLVRIKVGVSSENKKALDFWKCLGFQVYRVSKNIFETSDEIFENLVLMNKEKVLV